MSELERLGIADQISPSSYRKADTCYLEEDRDAGLYLDKLELLQEPFKFNELHKENTPIRNYPSYYL